jgi:hypothetical protein
VYDPLKEYQRLGVHTNTKFTSGWHLTSINAQYQYCATYPAVFAVPLSVSDDVLRQVLLSYF